MGALSNLSENERAVFTALSNLTADEAKHFAKVIRHEKDYQSFYAMFNNGAVKAGK